MLINSVAHYLLTHLFTGARINVQSQLQSKLLSAGLRVTHIAVLVVDPCI